MLTYNFILVAIGTFLLGITSGILGCFTFLKRQSLIGEVVSHSALPGVIIAFIILKSNAPLGLLIGSIISGSLSVLVVHHIVKHSPISSDSAFGVILSFFFGMGILLLGYLRYLPIPGKQAINSYLIGMASTMLPSNVMIITVMCFVIIGLVFLFWKELKIVTFDKNYAESLGFSSKVIEKIILMLVVLVICLGLEAVGIILTSSLLVIPPLTARQLVKSFNAMVFFSASIGGTSCFLGSWISMNSESFATGPAIVLVMASFFIIISLLASKYGIINRVYRFYRQKKSLYQPHSLDILATIQKPSK